MEDCRWKFGLFGAGVFMNAPGPGRWGVAGGILYAIVGGGGRWWWAFVKEEAQRNQYSRRGAVIDIKLDSFSVMMRRVWKLAGDWTKRKACDSAIGR
jgi:hypothetical protein